jgi:hypothetical protein
MWWALGGWRGGFIFCAPDDDVQVANRLEEEIVRSRADRVRHPMLAQGDECSCSALKCEMCGSVNGHHLPDVRVG